jgi:hypothetical protein
MWLEAGGLTFARGGGGAHTRSEFRFPEGGIDGGATTPAGTPAAAAFAAPVDDEDDLYN